MRQDEPWLRAVGAGFALAMLLIMASPFVALGAQADTPEEMPVVPPGPVEYVCPYEVMTAHSLQFNNYSGEYDALVDWFTNGDPWGVPPGTATFNFTGMNFGYPYPSTTNVTVLEDKLWVNELVGINLNTLLGAPYPDEVINPLIVLDADAMSTNNSVLWTYLNMGLDMWVANGSINDRSWFPVWLLDFRIYYSAYINLEPFAPYADNIQVFGFRITNCSRETYWQETTAFNWAYYSTQKLYQATLQVENNISTSHYYDVNWYVGYPADRVVDPATLRVWDLDNDLYLTLGQHYDASNAGVWLSFTRVNMSVTRSFTFEIYGWNATIGLGTFIAYGNEYAASSHRGDDYYMAVATGTNNYGRVYQGMVVISLSLDGSERYIDPASVDVYDNEESRWLEPWEYGNSQGLIFVDYAVVNVGDTQSYDVYFQLDTSTANRFDIMADSFIAGVSWMFLLLGVTVALGVASWWYKSVFGMILSVILLSMTLIAYFFSATMGGI